MDRLKKMDDEQFKSLCLINLMSNLIDINDSNDINSEKFIHYMLPICYLVKGVIQDEKSQLSTDLGSSLKLAEINRQFCEITRQLKNIEKLPFLSKKPWEITNEQAYSIDFVLRRGTALLSLINPIYDSINDVYDTRIKESHKPFLAFLSLLGHHDFRAIRESR